MKTKLLLLFCRLGFHNWRYSCGRYSRECSFCGEHQITIGEMGTSQFDHFATNIYGKLHACYYSKPIISRYVSFSTRDIIYECKCGNRKVFREYRDFSDPFPIETSMIESQKEFESYLNKNKNTKIFFC